MFASCSSEERSFSWHFAFANASTAARTERVETVIVRGASCTSTNEVYRAEISRDGRAATPPALGPGSYALWGRAISDDCRAIAYGCVQITLPAARGMEFQVILDDIPPMPVCTGSCAATCGPTMDASANDARDASSFATADDAGSRDAATDESSPDDAGGDASHGDGGETDASQTEGSDCTDGKARPGGHCYLFVTTEQLDWLTAEAACIAWGGHLVSLNDPDEELWVSDQVRALPDFTSSFVFWIGFNDRETETLWNWSDGSNEREGPAIITWELDEPSDVRFKVPFPDVYTHFGPNLPEEGNAEPNNGNSNQPAQPNPGEDCAVIRFDRLSGPGGIAPRAEWSDRPCTQTRRYICERP